MRLKSLLTLFLIVLSSWLSAQELPPITTFQPAQYGAENQNWSISQSSDDYIYVANNKGLLEFNGATWKLYPSPNESVVRSVKVVENRIYTGSYMDFGYWKKNSVGSLYYTSISASLNIPLIEDEQFWNIMALSHYVLFQSLNQIYIYNVSDQTYNIISSVDHITKMFKVDDTVYYQSLEYGIFKIESGKAVLVMKDSVFRDNTVVNMFNNNGDLLIQTQEQGFFIWKNEKPIKWLTSSTLMVDDLSVYNSIQLENGNFMLGTISNGIVYISAAGDFIYKIDQTDGLANNTVLGLFEDRSNNIWLALDNGINCINMKSALRIYNDENGDLGTVYSSILFNGFLYLGTNQGLFYKPMESKDRFKFIEGTKGQVWCLKNIGATLFCGHNLGTFVVNGDKAQMVASVPGAWDLQPFPTTDNLIIQGNYNGLHILHRQDGTWSLKHKLEGFDMSSRYFAVVSPKKVLVSHEYRGVFDITTNQDWSEIASIENESSVGKGVGSSLVTYLDQILYTYQDGVFKYDPADERFKKDSILSTMFSNEDYTSGKLISDVEHDRLWAFSERNIIYLSPGKFSDQPIITKIPLPKTLRKEMVGYETISYLTDDHYLLGTSSGYMILDLNKIDLKSYDVSINEIVSYAIDGDLHPVELSKASAFENKQNNIQFDYSVAEYNKYLQSEYQYKLIGYYDVWSPWSTESSVLFKNLPYGEYTFKVRSKVGNNLSNSEAVYQFQIKKPWYLTTTMLVLYVLLLVSIGYVVHIIYKRYYKKQKEKLLLKNKKELELRELESEQQMMQLKNEKLQQDVDNKNRELAISTMSLIKKNEFLNQIKEELKESKHKDGVKPVIKIIDKNINTNDDWKFFQEAFNNADKDFLKKIKTKHPKLTPNDLKLCAYLRLNLSSKEIAPLLNISPRSVEVKRYRLRKKMELPHETSLTHYILEL